MKKQASKRARGAPRRRSILVVDDEAVTVDVLTAVLADAGLRVIGAANGRDALAKLERTKPDLVLLDYMMPVLDGSETLKAIRQSDGNSQVPIVMMSGIPESMVKRRSRGYDAFLRKPFSLDELMSAVNRLLQREA
jgi:CheY-like chemotaxis protein